MPINHERILSKTQATERLMREFEDKALSRINGILVKSFQKLLAKLPAEFAKLEKGKSSLGLLRTKKLLEDLGEYLMILQPAQEGVIREILEDLYTRAIELGIDFGNETLEGLSEDFGISINNAALGTQANIQAASFAAQGSIERLKNYSEDFRVEATNIIALNLTLGIGVRKTAGQLRERFGLSKSRAETIARTETLAALNDAAKYTYKENGFEYVQYFATADIDTCQFCLGRNQQVYKINEISLPLHPRCRCFLVAVKVNPDWITDESRDFYEQTKKQAKLGLDATSPAPFEKIAGLTKAPNAVVKAPKFALP
jgi:SPP1 gp7 family putative phage head morphogenesis protein